MSLATNLRARIKAEQAGVLDLGTLLADVDESFSADLASGTSASQADLIWSDTRTLTASATENLDLAGVLADAFGATLTFVKIKAILIKAAAGNTNNVVIGNGSNPFLGPFGAAAHTLAVPPGGCVALFAPVSGWAVTAATADILKVANSSSGSSVTYDITIVGTSA